ncbi:uncharacterized protein LOC132538075 isoform X1 [Erinaceus europaeus]|uniref:Uncharacterized protein LOC132538075 isoform X1 n=1 Tax=Erinaceus europaeus TaxID=9365 RepID=A0ABM3X9W7_ERIEU|nr:uncharacterized protein LOC132538075 isoform X1 [Erinaceus europaeus]
MPLSRRGRRPRLAASPVASSSLPRAAAHPLRRVGRGTPLLSHELRLTRRRHSSEKIPTGPEPHADFRPGKGLQERAAGDATDAGEPLRAGMDSQYRLPSQEGIVVPCASDNDSGSVDLQLSNLENIQRDASNLELTGEEGKGQNKKRRGKGKTWTFLTCLDSFRNSPQRASQS